MILILSEGNDLSTTQVIEWLDIFKKKWVRINWEEKIRLEYSGKDVIFILDNQQFKLSDISSFWYRRGFFNFDKLYGTDIAEFDYFLNREMKDLISYLYYKLEKIYHLDSIRNSAVNKLIVNEIARELQLRTPEEYIFNKRTHLLDLLNNSKEEETFITKSISGDPARNFDSFMIYNYTSKVNINKINTDYFFPSLVQNEIKKKYELRIFYLKGICYSMAIFSQKDTQTSIDFRNYNNAKPNRRVPFKLPIIIEEKIDILMKKLNYDTGSIDMIITLENDYVFLEVNPVGQFGMTSFPCNYNIEKKIAEYL